MARDPLPRPITGQEVLLFDIATSLRVLCDHFAGGSGVPTSGGTVELKEPAAPKQTAPKRKKKTRKPSTK